ncbi:MAG TPA: ATPase domain-containing protein [Ignavibacteriales bacterium]|nr:ATPase domain-containing protein [Ignavibacteriales bacterium]
MKRNIQLVQTGLPLIDQAWGGFYKGGTYLLIGPKKSGRTLLGLQYAMQSARQKEVCLYFTNMRPKDLMIHAASIDFDIQTYMNQNLIVVVRVTPPVDLYDLRDPDEYLIEYLKDIVTVVEQFAPKRIIFDELTPYIGFSNLNLLRESFLETLENIEQRDVTSLFTIGEPATPVAQSIVDELVQHVTATIYLQKKTLSGDFKPQTGKMTITPNIGHTEGQFTANYSIEPYKGIVTDFKPAFPQADSQASPSSELLRAPQQQQQIPESRYQSLSSIETFQEPYSFSNFYEYNDFLLLLNNQIALYKSTGQIFSLVSFKLDTAAERERLLTINQLQNAVRLATDRKDKICVYDNKVIVLLIRSDAKSLAGLVSKIQANLPSSDPNYIKTVLQYISVLSVEVDEQVENAESIMKYVLGEEFRSDKNSDSFNRYNPNY